MSSLLLVITNLKEFSFMSYFKNLVDYTPACHTLT